MKRIFILPTTAILFILCVTSCVSIEKAIEKPNSESKIVIDTIFSTYLNEHRIISTYLPKGYTNENTYPVIYATDGQIIIDSYAKSLDSIIATKVIPEFILVGVYSNETIVPNSEFEYRNFEYIKDWADENDTLLNSRFSNHFKFFSEEAINLIEKKYSVAKSKNGRHFYGTSNGAGFGVTLGSENPDLFSNYLCFSMAGGNYGNLKWTESNFPYYYLSYGSEEPFPLIIAIKEFDEFLTQKKFKHSLNIYNGGHDRKLWKKEFLKILPEIIK
ncbi:alpha/beta hydrolase [Flavobacterium sp. SM2513]|uniref:alpha/beta hydrolase n=1 Tax=Flavobacterium sp. SM2513 TaxID=3424766 RepID=UPI003D7F43BD